MPKFFFDLETGGIDQRTSILSIGFAKDSQQAQELYAEPTAGTRMYKWSEENVWSRIKDKPKKSEESQLKSFLRTLQEQEEGTELIGWNIGYNKKYNEEAAGYDIQKLFQRARKFGLGSEYESALSKFQTRDIGKEFSIHLARANTNLPGIDPYAVEESLGYLKKNYLLGDPVSAEKAARYIPANVRLPGWRLSDIYKVAFGEELTGAHGAQQDVAATQKLHQYAEQYQGFNLQDQGTVERLQNLSRETHKRVLVSNIFNLKAESPEQAKTIYQEMIQRGKDVGITGIEDDLRKRLEDEGASFTDLLLGRGIQPKYRLYNRVDTSSFNIRNTVSDIADLGISYAKKNPWKTGIVGGLAAAYVLQAGSLFSGKDDEYNTIEGLGHGGQAEILRKMLTDFGSGYRGIRKALSQITGVAEDSLSKVKSWMKLSGVKVDPTGPGAFYEVDRNTIVFNQKDLLDDMLSKGLTQQEANLTLPIMLQHEAFEAFHTQRLGRKDSSYLLPGGWMGKKTAFGSHVTPAVIGDEMLVAAESGQASFNALKKFRLAEARSQSSREYERRIQKMYSTFETKLDARKKIEQANLQKATVKTMFLNGKHGGHGHAR